MRRLLKAGWIAVFLFAPQTSIAQIKSESVFLECSADARTLYTLSQTAYRMGYDVSLDIPAYFDYVSLRYIEEGLGQGFLVRENGEADRDYVMDRYRTSMEILAKKFEMEDSPEGLIGDLMERHYRGCSHLLQQ